MDSARTSDDGGLAFSNFDSDDGSLAFPNFQPPPHDQYMFVSDLAQRDERVNIPSADFSTQANESQRQAFSTNSLCRPPTSLLTATIADNIHIRNALSTTWMSPLQTHFNTDANNHESCDSNSSFSANGHPHPANSTAPTQWSYIPDSETPTIKQRRDSMRSLSKSAPGPVGRQRKTERVEAGSARAVYLEKNRHAASKCRTKQKRQQEDLVDAARDMERKNKVLKSEVEILKSDLRDLMELVGKHNECPDGRLRRYLQLEADRLSQCGSRNAGGEPLSPRSNSSGGDFSPNNT